MVDEPRTTTSGYGALPPEGHQIGDRADKACVMEAVLVFFNRGIPIGFDAMQAAIDAYLASAKQRGWTLA